MTTLVRLNAPHRAPIRELADRCGDELSRLINGSLEGNGLQAQLGPDARGLGDRDGARVRLRPAGDRSGSISVEVVDGR